MFEKPDASEPAKKRPKLSIESTPSIYTAEMQDDPENSIVMAEDTESPLKEFKEPSQLTEFLEHPEQFFLSEQFANACVIEEETLLTYCIRFQHTPTTVQRLLHCGADPNIQSRRGITPISVAAHKGSVEIVQMLIDKGATVNAVNTSGSTALIQAAHFGHLPVVELLLIHEANADFCNSKGKASARQIQYCLFLIVIHTCISVGTTALMRASQEGHADIARVLLRHNVDVNRKNLEGMNALMLASQRGHGDLVELLIQHKASIDEQTGQGSTALMLACKRGHEKCAQVLVSYGAEVYMRDRRQRTARDTAMKRNHANLLMVLDTQWQIRQMQERSQVERRALLETLRQAVLKFGSGGRVGVQLHSVWEFLDGLKAALRERKKGGGVSDGGMLSLFLSQSPSLPYICKTPYKLLSHLETLIDSENSVYTQQAAAPHPLVLAHPHYAQMVYGAKGAKGGGLLQWHMPPPSVPNYEDYMWPKILHRALSLPHGVWELVAEYLPLPRVWRTTLSVLPRRIKLSAHVAMQDLSTIMDEVLTDTGVVAVPFGSGSAGGSGRHLLQKVATSPQLHPLLVNLGMPTTLVEEIVQLGPLQPLLSLPAPSTAAAAASLPPSFTPRPPLARSFLSLGVSVYKWGRQRSSVLKWLNIMPSGGSKEGREDEGAEEGDDGVGEAEVDGDGEDDFIAATDAGGEGESEAEAGDFDGVDASAGEQGLEGVLVEGLEDIISSDDED
eukprot:gene28574-34495_t